MSNSARTLLVDAEKRFKSAGIDAARVDAELLLAHALGISRNGISLLQEIDESQKKEFEKLCQLRQQRIPLQHLTGEQGFRRLNLKVGKGVFIPRPETELLVESAVRYLRELPSSKVIDFCSGSGAIAISLATEVPNCQVIAVEVSEGAVEYLKKNIEKNQDQIDKNNSSVEVAAIDVMDFAEAEKSFDAVVANPPYIPERMVPKDPEVALHDPKIALFSGLDGLDLIREIIQKSSLLLKTGGFIGIEHAELQGDRETGVPGVLKNTGGFSAIEDRKDLNGLARYTVAEKI